MDFYYMPGSAPCRSVMMAARAFGVTLNLKPVDLMAGEHMTPEFLKMNLQHTIPTLGDGDFYLNESRAMLQYLANKYAKGDKEALYPKDPKERANVDMKLYFDMGTLYANFGVCYYPAIFAKAPLDPEKLEKLNNSLGFLEQYLKDGYVAGGHLTIADYAIAASLSTIAAVHDISAFPKARAYLEKLSKEIDGYKELNQAGVEEFAAWAKPALGQ